MKLLTPIVLAFVLIASNEAFAQKQMQQETTLGLSHMLRMGTVRQELGLSAVQCDQIGGLSTTVRAGLEKAFKNHRMNYTTKLSADDKEKLEQKLVNEISDVRTDERRQIEDALTDEQFSRLKQIRFQYLRRSSNGLKSLVDDLELSDDQVADLNNVANKFTSNVNSLRSQLKEGDLTPAELQEELVSAKEASEEELLDVLSSQQKRKLSGLQGETFDFTGKSKASSR